MINNGKEYPATHSMSTAWFFVDKEDNVAIFDFEDNGPIPVGAGRDNNVTDLCFYDTIVEQDGRKRLNFTDEQVLAICEGQWEEHVPDDYYFSQDIVQIDLSKENQFFDYLAVPRKKVKEEWDNSFAPICLSKKYGIYLLDLDSYKYGYGMKNKHVKYLFDNGIILRYCQSPYYDNLFDADEEEDVPEFDSCPYYLYSNDYDEFYPHKRYAVPKYPMKLSQMPSHLKDKVLRLDLKFSESESIQIAHELPCYSYGSWTSLKSSEGYSYNEVQMPSGEVVYCLDCEDEEFVRNLPKDVPRILSREQALKILSRPKGHWSHLDD